LRALPDHLPVSLEVPNERWAKSTGAVERAIRLREAALDVIAQAYRAD
jgi:hypothetical protein